MANNVSITNLKEYAERMAKSTEIRYVVTMHPKAREWFLRDLEQRAKKVNDALNSDTIKEKNAIASAKGGRGDSCGLRGNRGCEYCEN